MLLFKPAKPDRHFDPFVQTDSIKIKQETQNSLNRPAGLTTGEVSVGKIPANSNTVVASAEVHTQHYDAELTETLPNKGTHPIQIPDFIQQIQLPQSLDEQTPTKQSIFSQDTHKTELITPIKLDRLKHFLTGYSDKEFLVYGFQWGFHLGYSVSNPSHRITLTKESRKDLKAWQIFVDNFNGKLLLPEHRWVTSDSLHFYTDASGTFGYGAVFKTHWFYGPWQDHQLSNGITWKELFPIVLAIDTLGPLLQNKCITLHSDNYAVVYILNKQTTKNACVMHLVRRFVMSCMKYNLLIKAVHVPGKFNQLPDALSRFQIAKFHSLAPWMDEKPTPVPNHLFI